MISHKNIAHDSVEEWIRTRMKSHIVGSVIWKAVVLSFHVLKSNLAWNVGNGRRFRVGEDTWVGSTQQHLLPSHTMEALR